MDIKKLKQYRTHQPQELESWGDALNAIERDLVEISYFAKRGYQPKETNYDDLSVQERRLFDVNPDDFEWAREFINPLPEYLTKYFVNRYVEIYKKHISVSKNKARKEANQFLNQKMGKELNARIGKVLDQYRNIPTTNKIASLKSRLETLKDEEQATFEPSEQPEEQLKFDLEALEERVKTKKPVKKRILAEMEIDELKDMAFTLSSAINQYFVELSGGNKLEADTEITQDMTDVYEAYVIILAYEDIANLVEKFGIKAPRKYKRQTDLSALQDISRMISEKWWLNRLKKIRKIMREHLAIAMGQVSARASAYASWDCIKEHQEQQKKNWDFIQNAMLFDVETEEETELKDMVLKSVSNPAIRRHELMVRTRGCEDIGNSLGLQGLFLTLTTPAAYHNSYKKGGFIDHWNGSNPKQAQDYLNKVWQRIRAKLGREEIRWYGVRVAEPHHDGTPHWHLLIWVKPEDVDAVKEIFIDYATKKDRHELMKSGRFDYSARCDVQEIDPELGTATGYIAKYISKNIDGYAMDDEVSDETDKPVKDMAKNVTAWKSRWNIRQFQFFGGAPVTTYRELRRFASQNKKAFMEYVFMQDRVALIDMYGLLHFNFMGPIKPAGFMSSVELMEAIGSSYESRIDSKHSQVSGTLKAADHGNWMGYIMGQGGPFVKRDDLLIRNEYKTIPFGSPHGEDVKKIEGFTALGESWQTRLKEWSIVSKKDLEKLKKTDQAEAGALALSGSAASPWSSVNNCTITVDPQSVKEAVAQILGKSSYLDELAFEALCKGHSIHIGGSQYIKLRNPKTSTELVTYDQPNQHAEREWLEKMGLLDEPEPEELPKPPPGDHFNDENWPNLTKKHTQPDLSRYPDLTSGGGEWPLV